MSSCHLQVFLSRILLFACVPRVKLLPNRTLTAPNQSLMYPPTVTSFNSFFGTSLHQLFPKFNAKGINNPCDAQAVLVSNSLEDTSSTSSSSGNDDQILIYSQADPLLDSASRLWIPATDENSSEYSDMIWSPIVLWLQHRTFLQRSFTATHDLSGTFGPPDFDSDDLARTRSTR